MSDSPSNDTTAPLNELPDRRKILQGMGKWSGAAIMAAAAGASLGCATVVGAGSWVNRRVGGGGSWINRRGGWVNRGGGWLNRRGGGGGWINRRCGGGSWINRR